jgi:hypothetical protein
MAFSVQLEPPLASTVPIKRPRGRPRKVKLPIDLTNSSLISSMSAITDKPLPLSENHRPDTTPIKIDESQLSVGEPRVRDKSHLKFVASQPCLICGRSPVHVHHLRFAQPRAMGLKVSDEFTVPLCRTHHRDNQRFGDEAAWERRAIDPLRHRGCSGFRPSVSNES